MGHTKPPHGDDKKKKKSHQKSKSHNKKESAGDHQKKRPKHHKMNKDLEKAPQPPSAPTTSNLQMTSPMEQTPIMTSMKLPTRPSSTSQSGSSNEKKEALKESKPPSVPVRVAPPRPTITSPQSNPQPQPTPIEKTMTTMSDPDLDKTEKKTKKDKSKSSSSKRAGKKITKLLKVKIADVIESHKNNVGKLPQSASRMTFDRNLELNRFEDVVCIDQTMVRMADPSMYLNASWVEITGKKKVILAQLPLAENGAAFWSMIAEHNIKGILLLLDDVEFSSFGADQIFPLNRTTAVISDDTTVTHTHRLAVNSDWTMNVYQLVKGDIRKYVHVHFYSWSGDGILPLNSLWQIESVFRKYKLPHVYMSSAGIGRAATFAALQKAHTKLHESSSKSVCTSDCISSIREQRMHAIQCLSQSVTVHAALVQHIIDCPAYEKKENDPKVKSFMGEYKKNIANVKE